MKQNNTKNNINLLQTNFKMKGNLNLLQYEIIKFWYNIKIYKKILFKKKKIFILHDGPPFSNSDIHLGHILNKILKDIIIKFKNLCGYNSKIIFGWDCFGFPIENKFKKIRIYKNKIIHKQILIKNYINNIINKQKKNFKELGIFFNSNYIYKTISNKNISEEIKVLYNFFLKKYLYNDFKPSYWCIYCNSYLSKSEINYKFKFDLSLMVIFFFLNLFFFLKKINLKKKYLIGGILIWTTLPWTLLSNQAILLDEEYIYVYINTTKGNYIINLQKYVFFKKNINFKFYSKKFFLGFFFKNVEFINSLFKINNFFYNKINIIILKNKIKNLGTGIVHLAPNFGADDYKIYKLFKKKNIKLKNLFSNKGGFLKKKFFFKKKIFFLNKKIIYILFKYNKIFFFKKYYHNYLFCLKHKKPIFYKLTKQWYLRFKNFYKNKINKIIFLPKNYKKKFENILKKKPNWNISRQRFWGVCMTILVKKNCNYNNLLKFIFNYIELYNTKFWNYFFLSDIYKKKSLFYKKLYDTLDVWFDSGVTNWNILKNTYKNILKFPADLYLEGEDQHRGWFQSSLIISLLLNKKLPFKTIITHGFIKTIYGEKFSKSLNNYLNYKILFNYINIDILRLLFCNIKYSKNIILTKNLLNNSIDIYRKIRNCLRFILSNISDLKYNIFFFLKKKYYDINNSLIYYFYKFCKKILLLYDKYNFKKIINKIKDFFSNDISSIYFNIIKNNLYIDILNSKKRKYIQNILFILLINIIKILSPIISFTTEEIFKKLFYKKSIFENYFLKIIKKKNNYWIKIKFIKYIFYKKIEILKKKNKFLNIDIKLILFINKNIYFFFKKNKISLINLFFISKININLIKYKKIYLIFKIYKKQKCFRCLIKKKIIKNKNICIKCYINLYKQNIYI